MTTQEKTPIRALIEGVEVGRTIGLNVKDVCRALGWKFPDTRTRHILEAEVGSLDAAKALHEALLPDRATVEFWHSKRYEDESYVYVHMPDAVYSGRADNPARAWLIAILKAYEAQQ